MFLPLAGPRKEAILSLTPPAEVGAEIGADHGLISAGLIKRGICRKMLISDISAASLEKARELFSAHGIAEYAHFRVADGLQGLPEMPQTIVIAGMGAMTIADILRDGKSQTENAWLVLQPNPNPPYLRRYLAENGYRIYAERLAYEGGRYYIVMLAKKGKCSYTQKELELGPCLLKDRPEGFEAYLTWRRGCALCQHGNGRDIVRWIQEEL